MDGNDPFITTQHQVNSVALPIKIGLQCVRAKRITSAKVHFVFVCVVLVI